MKCFKVYQPTISSKITALDSDCPTNLKDTSEVPSRGQSLGRNVFKSWTFRKGNLLWYHIPRLLFLTVILCSCSGSENDGPNADDGLDATDNGSVDIQLVNAFPNLSFQRPLDFQSPNDGTNRIFVVEQGGTVKVFDNSEMATESPVFLDISPNINTSANEQGLLGLAFHPNFEGNGYFYINYTPSRNLSVISRFQVSTTDPNVADPNSELILLEIPQPFTNHNGGQLAFGPDGFLYVASGDGGSAGDPQNLAQNRSNLLGCILRINVDGRENGLNYAIPPDNPFVGEDNVREEIFAYGFRNPWRMSFDAQTGSLWSADVGQDEREEINIITSGGNYGWKLFEGTFCFSGDCDTSNLVAPVFEYAHNGNDRSVTGGYVYRGDGVASLQGNYIYADFVDGRIWALSLDGNTNELLLNTDLNIASFGVDANDELYLCAFDGTIYKFQERNQ